MKDFTLRAYKRYLMAIRSSFPNILRFDKFFLSDPKPESFCLIRHDVDRKPQRALQIANIENDLQIKTTYFFRTKPSIFKPDMIAEISRLGHEIGYHYESLSDTNGNLELAFKDFEKNLTNLRRLAPVRTISMHGRPFNPFDNRAMWRKSQNRALLSTKYAILGEIYLDIDYDNIAYISDTGRNWSSTKANIRDKVNSSVSIDFKTGDALYDYLYSVPHPRMIFQIHPERWSDAFFAYYIQYLKDHLVNIIKYLQ